MKLSHMLDGRARIGLVLGAGGPVGHAFHAGALLALSHALQWDPRKAGVIVGTSAGAQVGALLRAGIDPHDLKARILGTAMTPAGRALARHYTRPDPAACAPDTRRPLRPAATDYFARTWRRPWSWKPGAAAAALLPEGRASLHPQAEGLRNLFGDQWPSRPLWIPAMHLETGERVVFGRAEAPDVEVGTAVICSSAVPGVWEPVDVDAHRYVDGGLRSPTHVDLLETANVDAVIVSSPLSRFAPMRALLRWELRRLHRQGVPVIAIEPCPTVTGAMGWNPMNAARAPAVATAAYASLMTRLRSSSAAHRRA